MSTTQTTSSPALIVFAWVIVLVPLIWGVIRTLENVLKLFA